MCFTNRGIATECCDESQNAEIIIFAVLASGGILLVCFAVAHRCYAAFMLRKTRCRRRSHISYWLTW